MQRCLYDSTFKKFIQSSSEALLGEFVDNYHGPMLDATREAWVGEIDIMKDALQERKEEPGQIIFEYNIPRLGKRIDVVLLLRGLIFCLEFKVGKKNVLQQDIRQVLDLCT